MKHSLNKRWLRDEYQDARQPVMAAAQSLYIYPTFPWIFKITYFAY